MRAGRRLPERQLRARPADWIDRRSPDILLEIRRRMGPAEARLCARCRTSTGPASTSRSDAARAAALGPPIGARLRGAPASRCCSSSSRRTPTRIRSKAGQGLAAGQRPCRRQGGQPGSLDGLGRRARVYSDGVPDRRARRLGPGSPRRCGPCATNAVLAVSGLRRRLGPAPVRSARWQRPRPCRGRTGHRLSRRVCGSRDRAACGSRRMDRHASRAHIGPRCPDRAQRGDQAHHAGAHGTCALPPGERSGARVARRDGSALAEPVHQLSGGFTN